MSGNMVIEKSTDRRSGRIRVGDESDIFEEGPHSFVRLKGSRTHDISYSNDHISSIKKIGSDLNEAIQAVWINRHIRYFQAYVLMLSWEDDDLRVEPELEGLEYVFEGMFNFHVQKYKIPSTKPDKELKGRMYEFLKNDSRDTLLIVYYAGHARRAFRPNEASLWFPNKQNPTIAIPSSGVQSMLEEADSDVLLLFDCCHSAALPTTDSQQRSTGVKEVISACGYDEIAPEADEHSFTKALTDTLAIASKGEPFSVGHLHSRTLSKLKCWAPSLLKRNGKYVENAEGRLLYEHQPRKTPVYSIICETNPRRSIILAPMPPLQDSLNSCLAYNTPDSSAEPKESPGSDHHDEFSSRKRKRPNDDEDEKDSQILLAIRLESKIYDPDMWLEWFRSAPPGAQEIRVEGIYDSFSTLLILRMPVAVWNLLPENPSYSFIGFVTSANKASNSVPACPCTDVCDQCVEQIRAAKTLNVHQPQDHYRDISPPQENQAMVTVNQTREGNQGDSDMDAYTEYDSDVDVPCSSISSFTTAAREEAPQPTFSKLNYYDALRSQIVAIDGNLKGKSTDTTSQTTTSGTAGCSPSSEELASSFMALHISLEKSKARDFSDVSNHSTPVIMMPESESIDSRLAAYEERAERLRNAYIDPIPSKSDNALPPSQSVDTAHSGSSGSSNFLHDSKVSLCESRHRHSHHHRSDKLKHKGGESAPTERFEWFWLCCACQHSLLSQFTDACPEFSCGHTRCTKCTWEQYQVRTAEDRFIYIY